MMTNPYPGLRPFEYAENHLFFGREGHAQKIASRLEQNHFVAVVGSSGSGKSSIVRAGLLPLLYGGRMFGSSSKWQISLMRPGDTPIHNLATSLVHPEKFDDFGLYNEKDPVPPQNEHKIGIVEAILRRSGVGLIDHLKTADLEDGENLLIVVDQFEELFRFKEKMRVGHLDEATAFVKLLLEATSDKQNRIYIIITMRSDFLGDCAEFRGLPEAINDGQYLVSRMTRNQLRSSIESPAKVFDAEVSPVLVNHLLNKIDSDSTDSLEVRERMLQDQLPVMQHALIRTWDEWESRNTPDKQIAMEHYKATGGMEKALSNHANEAFAELNHKQKLIAEKMFKCLTEKDEENRETRRPTTISEICAVAEVEKEAVFAVIEVFRQEGRTFLMPPPVIPLTENTKIDISHESLIRNWDVLKKWVEEEAKDAWQYRRLSEDAKIWIENNKNEDFLWRGRAVEDASEWWNSFSPNQIWAKRYQILTDEEKNQLADISLTSPDEAAAKREEFLIDRFNKAKAFFDESQKFDVREREREERIRKAEIKSRYIKILTALLGVVVILLGAVVWQRIEFNYITNQRKDVKFDTGANYKSYEDKLLTDSGTNEYVLHANEGQQMIINISSTESNLKPVFSIIAPNEKTLAEEQEETWRSRQLPKTGNYKIIVSTSGQEAEYKITFKVEEQDATKVEFNNICSQSYKSVLLGSEEDEYILDTKNKDQQMTVNFKLREGNPDFDIIALDGKTLAAEQKETWKGKLPEITTYRILVKGSGKKDAYEIEFKVKNTEEKAENKKTVVNFGKGCIAKTYEDSILNSEPNEYQLGAGKNQQMTVSIEPTAGNPVFDIIAPKTSEEKKELLAEKQTTWSGQLPKTGNYKIIVSGSGKEASYKITFEVTDIWFVILGNQTQIEEAKKTLQEIKSKGLNTAKIINTNDYPGLKDGYHSIVIGYFPTESEAQSALKEAKSFVSDAYIKSGSE